MTSRGSTICRSQCDLWSQVHPQASPSPLTLHHHPATHPFRHGFRTGSADRQGVRACENDLALKPFFLRILFSEPNLNLTCCITSSAQGPRLDHVTVENMFDAHSIHQCIAYFCMHRWAISVGYLRYSEITFQAQLARNHLFMRSACTCRLAFARKGSPIVCAV
jgi:hypothetical protein